MKLWRYGRPLEYLGQRYRLDGMLGSGGMADVCLAWDEREQREVAIKVLKSDDLDQETLNRFMKEAAQVAHWQHPHILRIYESLQIELIDAAQGSVLFYMVTEYARGGDLQKRLTPGRPFPLSASFALFRQLCDAVQYAHERGIIHRDLKPLNILFRRPASGPEEVVLSDFGLAVQVDASHHTFARGGTLAYMAPEQFQGNAQPASDIFALGVILYLLCTGQLPFRRTLQDLPRIVQTREATPTRPGLLNPDLPSALDGVLLRALHELPAERYHQANELWAAIELVLTASAQTFPFVEEFWQNAGQTWPFDGTELPQRSRQFYPASQPAFSNSLPAKQFTPVEEGPASVSDLGSVREKQKASPGRVPGSSLPIDSILALPNPPGTLPPGTSAPRTHAPGAHTPRASGGATFMGPGAGDDEGAQATRAPGRSMPHTQTPGIPTPRPRAPQASGGATFTGLGNNDEGDERVERGPGVTRANRPGRSNEPGIIALPAASASGSATLPRPARSRDLDADRTSRRHPSDADATRQTSRRRVIAPRTQDTRDQSQGATTRSRRDTWDTTPSTSRGSFSRDASAPGPPVTEDVRGSSSRGSSPPGAASSSPGETRAVKARGRQGGLAALLRTRGQRGHGQGGSTRGRGSGRRVPLVPLLTALVLVVLVIAILAATAFQGPLLRFFGAPVTTVTLTPRSQTEQTSLALDTTPGASSANQIQARQISATSPTQSATANATGSIPAKRATGQLTFINNTANAITIQSVVLTGQSGVQISFDGPITIPANPPTIIVTGFAVQAGAAGNIPTLDISKPCCAPNGEIFVKNTAFTGGQDAQANSVIEQKDINGAANSLVAAGKARALAALQGQVHGNERVVNGSQQCQPRTTANHKAGDVAKSVTAQVVVTCGETVYDDANARLIAARQLQGQVSGNPGLGPAYALEGQLALEQTGATPDAHQPQTLSFQARGLWVYQFSQNTLRQFATLIAGKSQDAARALLLSQPGIADAQFSPSGTLPVNTSEIQFVTRNVPF